MIAIKPFDLTYEQFSQRYLHEHPGATEARCRMEFANAQAGPELAAALHRSSERQLSGVDLKANLEEARKLIDGALGFLNDGTKQ